VVDPQGEGFEAFFRREYVAQVRVAYVIIGDDGLAREIAQEAFARALQRWNRLATYERPGAWVRLVCVRLAIRSRDKRAVEVSQEVHAPQGVADSMRDLDLPRALLALPRAQRTVVALHHLCDWPMSEVAAALRIRQSTARVHLARGRAALAALLAEEVRDGA
jgi:RNA polymerase sigma-70 factor (ECF subfamily)